MSKPSLIGLIVTIILIAVIGYVVVSTNSARNIPTSIDYQTGLAPWSIETGTLKQRLSATGLPALSAEGTVLHTHEHLDIYLHGQKLPIPADTGIGPTFIAPIHTHDDTGIIHVESPSIRTYTLGQFFSIWGVRFTSACLGGYCSDTQNQLEVFSNGQKVTDSPGDLPLSAHEEIVITYGTQAERPNPIPSGYNFPPGY